MPPDAQYAIDIAASMPEGEATIAELDRLTEGLVGAGKDAEHFQVAIKRVSAELDAAKMANIAASEALKEGTREYRVLERAALQTAKAAERAAIKNNGVIPDDVRMRAEQASAAVNTYARRLRDLESAAKQVTAAEEKQARTLDNLNKLQRHANTTLARNAESLSKFRGALGAVGGPLGALGSSAAAPVHAFAELNQVMGASRAAALIAVVGLAAVTAAIVALTAAAVAGVAAIAAWGVSLGDARRSAGLAQEAAEALHPDLVALRGDFDAITNETGQSADALRKLVGDLRGAKVSAEDMPRALRAVALAETALGAGGAAQFVSDIKAGKLAVDEFAHTAEAKFGGVVARQMLGLEAQSARFKRSISDIFGSLDIEPALEGLRTLVGLFDKTTVAGQTIKFLFETVFQPIIDQAQNAAYAVEAFALGFLIGLTKVYIAIKPAIRAIGEFFGFEDTSLESVLALVTKAGEYAAYVFVGFVAVIAAVGAAFAAAVTIAISVQAALVALPIAIYKLGEAASEAIFGTVKRAFDYLANVSLEDIGRDLMAGLADGIIGGGAAVVGAISGAVGSAIKKAKSLLGISSPSKVFAGIGEDTAEGFAMGVDRTAEKGGSALDRLVSPESPLLSAPTAAPAFPSPAVSSSPASGGGDSAAGIRFGGPVTFNLYGVKDASDAVSRIDDLMTRLLEGDATALGAAEAGATA